MTKKVEQEVRDAMAADPNYPLGEVDAMKWAIAFRLTAQMANPLGKALRAFPHSEGQEPLDGIMVGWFANCMASAHPKMLMQRGDAA